MPTPPSPPGRKDPAPSRREAWLAWPLLLAGAMLRALYLLMPSLDGDMAMWGLQAMDILEGRWHFLFSGELLGGNLEAWLAAPLFWLLGPGALALCLVPALFSLLMLWALWRLARRELGIRGGLLALAWAALAPYYLVWHSVLPRGAYIEVPLLAVLCFQLTLRLASREDDRGGGLAAFSLGALAGLGLWTHLLMLPAILACLLYLLWARPGLFASRLLPLALAGLFLGGLPLWVISLPAGLLSGEVIGEGRSLDLASAWRKLWDEGLPLVLGLMGQEQLPWPWLWPWLRAALLAVYGLLAALAAWGHRRELFSRRRGSLAALAMLYLVLYLAVWLGSGAQSQGTWRHLTPLYAALPLLFAAALAGPRQPRPGLVLLIALPLLGFQVWGGLALAPALDPARREAHRHHRDQERSMTAWLDERGYRHVYAQEFWDALPLTLAAAGRVTFADQVENHLPRLLRLADASPRAAYVLTTRAADFGGTLKLAGIGHDQDRVGRFTVFHNFTAPAQGLREIPPGRWSSPQAGAGDAWDRDLSTRWTTGRPQQPGQVFTLDLGQVHQDVCQVVLMPGAYRDAAAGLRVSLSGDGLAWQAVAEYQSLYAPLFWSLDRPLTRVLPARQQVRFAPRQARFIRIEQTQRQEPWWWSLAEVFVFQADPAAPPRAGDQGPVGVPTGAGPVYAPPQVLAGLEPGAAGVGDPQRPPPGFFDARLLAVRLGPGALLDLPAANWPASAALLEPLLAGPPTLTPQAGGLRVGGLAPRPAPPPLDPPAGASARASHNPGLAGLALDGSLETRWDSGSPQRPGQWYQLDLGQELVLAGLVLDQGRWVGDRPRGLAVEVSADGRSWRTPEDLLVHQDRVFWAGDRLLWGGGRVLVRFATQAVRHLRLTQTGSHPVLYWSIARLQLLGPGHSPPARPSSRDAPAGGDHPG